MFFQIKTYIRQKILKVKFSKKNIIMNNVFLSKDFIVGTGCYIGMNSIIGKNVKLMNNIRIGRNVFLENISIDIDSVIESGVKCTGSGKGKIIIGKNSYIGINNILDWSDNITIGDYVHIAGPSTGLWTHSSAKQALAGLPLKNKDIKYRPTAPIIIENNVYIGGNCTIYPGVTIHHHSIVAPNSAVTKDVDSYSLVGGVPAKKIRSFII